MLNVQRSISSALLAASAFLLSSGRAAEPDPKAVSIKLPDNIEWRKGAAQDSVLLQGDPSKAGVYIQMIKWHPGNMSRPHFHSTDRFIYVVSGTWWVGTGSKYDPSSTYPVPAGSYVIDKANEIHYDGAKDGDCVLYLVGTGPMTTTQAEKK